MSDKYTRLTETKTLYDDLRERIAGTLQGPKGDQGIQGLKGDAATINVGTVTKGEVASVTNSGNENAAVFDFVLPKGDKGDTGLQGPQGEKGDGFKIVKYYKTIEEMNADYSNPEIKIGDFVGITDGVNDLTIYAKGSTQFDFISNMEGIVGPAGYTPVRGKDYWTPEDVKTIETYVDTKLGVIDTALDEINGETV